MSNTYAEIAQGIYDELMNYLFEQNEAPQISPVPKPRPQLQEPLIDEKMLRDAIQNEFPRFKVQEGGVHGRKDITI